MKFLVGLQLVGLVFQALTCAFCSQSQALAGAAALVLISINGIRLSIKIPSCG